jgi:hypothetical protein
VASNTVKIREIMKRVKERQAQKESVILEKSKPVKAVDKFDHVESKLKQLLIVLFTIVFVIVFKSISN